MHGLSEHWKPLIRHSPTTMEGAPTWLPSLSLRGYAGRDDAHAIFMAIFNYLSFSSKEGLLVGNGGAWSCTGFDGSCSQSSGGPITSTSTPGFNSNGYRGSYMTLGAAMNLADDEFKGATSVPSTLSFSVQATSQGGSPAPMTLQSNVGGISQTHSAVQYNTGPVSVTRSGTWGYRPTQITLEIDATCLNFSISTVTLAISDLTFVIHDVVYGTTFVAGSSSPSTSIPSSSFPSTSGSVSTSSINNGTSVSHSTTFTTTISGHPTVIGSMLPEPSNSESQSQTTTYSTPPASGSITVSERAGLIAGSLVGLGIMLIVLAFWYQWWRRRRINHSRETPYGDEQGGTHSNSRMMHQGPLVPYRERSHSSTTENAIEVPVEDDSVEPVELENHEVHSSVWQTRDGSSGQPFSPPPPPYSQLSPGLRPVSVLSST